MSRPTTKKNAIIDSAVRLFVEKGISETTIRDIAAAAGVADGALYRHWGGKQEMARDLFEERFSEYGRKLHKCFVENSDYDSRLRAILDYHLDEHDKDPMSFRFVLFAQHQTLRYLKNIPPDENPIEVIHQMVKAGVESGELKPINPQLGMSMLVGAFLQIAVSSIYGRVSPSLSNYKTDIYRSLKRLLDK